MSAAKMLPKSLRRELESLFGADFSRVRIRESALSWPLARTRGEDVCFAPGAHDPCTPAGREVLGHELAHVLQQRAGRVRPDNGRELEAEAIAAGRAIMLGRPVRLPGRPAARPTLAVQCYNVVAPAGRAGANLNVVNGQHNAPTQPTDSFPGQDKGGWVGHPGSFLLAGGGVNITSGNHGNVSIRVSNNGNMAIEEANLLTRQPKVCYLAAGIMNAGNIVLNAQGSHFQLVADPAGPAQRSITVNGVPLIRVTPQNVNNGTAGLAMNAAQPCDSLVQDVIGHAPTPQFLNPLAYPAHIAYEYHIARALLQPPPGLPAALPLAGGVGMATAMTAIASRFSTEALAAAPAFTAALQNHGVNEYAAPNIGQGFLTCTLIASGAGASIPPGPPTQFDHYRLAAGNPQVIQVARAWNTHWAGVVAVDGNDVITLENYARNAEDALQGNDTRYYFQMYNTNPPPGGAGSWHHAWTSPASLPMQPIAPPPAAPPGGIHPAATHEPVSPGARSFANPITLMVG